MAYGPAVSALTLNLVVEQITQGRSRLPGGFGASAMVQIDPTVSALPGAPGYLIKLVGSEYGPSGHGGTGEGIPAVIAAYNHIAKGTPLPAPGSFRRQAQSSPWYARYRYEIAGGAALLALGGVGIWWWRRR
jgi:hypothetical protein